MCRGFFLLSVISFHFIKCRKYTESLSIIETGNDKKTEKPTFKNPWRWISVFSVLCIFNSSNLISFGVLFLLFLLKFSMFTFILFNGRILPRPTAPSARPLRHEKTVDKGSSAEVPPSRSLRLLQGRLQCPVMRRREGLGWRGFRR